MVAYGDPDIPEDLEMRNIVLNPRAGPNIHFVLVAGIHLLGVSQVCERFAKDFKLYYLDIFDYLQELCHTSKHEREAYGYLHPSAYAEQFNKQLSQSSFIQSTAFTFFLMPILRYKIDREISNGWTAFLVSELEESLRAVREFSSKIAQPVAVFCFRHPAAGHLAARTVIEQLFSEDELVGVPVHRNLEATYGRLLAETIGKRGIPSSPSYSPSA